MYRELAGCACLALSLALSAATASAQLSFNPAWALDGGLGGSAFGASVASAGDVNGDGFDDVIVGAPSASNGQTWEGQAYIYLGSATGLSTTPSWTAESDVAFAFFGAAVAGAGDVNSDGFDDVLVGAPQYANNAGRAFFYLGTPGGPLLTPAWVKSGPAGGQFGESLAGVGDTNGDGYDDIAISSWLDSAGGHVYVFLGQPTGPLFTPAAVLTSPQTQARFGHGLAGAGDVNGDGFADLIVGAQSFSDGQSGEGAAFLYLGSPSSTATTPAWTAENDVAFSQFGESVAGAGDLDGDGYDDVAVGAPLYDIDGISHEGRVYVYRGTASGLEAQPAASPRGDQNSNFGWSLASAGDVNADGYADLLVGADNYADAPANYIRGRSFVFLGSATGITEIPDWYGWVLSTDAYVGASVGGAFDCNGDGFDDIIAGGMNMDSGAQHAQVHLGGHFGAAAPYGRGKALNQFVYAPRLVSYAPPKLGGTASLDFVGGTPFASPVFVVAGFQPAALAFDQGTLLVVPFTIAFLPQLPGDGAFHLQVHLPNTPAAQGLDLYLQAGCVDPGAVGQHHTVLSNGLHWVFGE